MLRGLGAGLILCAALLVRHTLLCERRTQQRVRRALAAALEAMEAEIRALLTPLPDLFRRERGTEIRAFFSCFADLLGSGTPIADAWRGAVGILPLPEDERDALALFGARLNGDEDGVCAALTLTARTLRTHYEEAERRRGQEERLTTALCLSAGLLLAILLL